MNVSSTSRSRTQPRWWALRKSLVQDNTSGFLPSSSWGICRIRPGLIVGLAFARHFCLFPRPRRDLCTEIYTSTIAYFWLTCFYFVSFLGCVDCSKRVRGSRFWWMRVVSTNVLLLSRFAVIRFAFDFLRILRFRSAESGSLFHLLSSHFRYCYAMWTIDIFREWWFLKVCILECCRTHFASHRSPPIVDEG